MSSTPVEKAFCTTTEAATLLGVSVGTVQMWVESGLLQAWKTAGGHRRVMRDSVQALLHKGPVVEASPVAAPVEPEAVTEDRRFTILVVEDDVKLLRMYEATLSRWPMQPKVITASSATAGLVSVGRFNPDMLITDLHMPGMDGFDMLRELDRMPETGQTVIVAVTGLDDDAIKAHGGVPVGVQVLPKPIPFVRLLDIANVALSLRKARSARATSPPAA